MHRRKKIIDSMMSKDEGKKKQGEVLLNNYKRQLAERMAREKQMNSSSMKDNTSSKMDSFMNKRIAEFESSDIPDPEVLRAILHKRGAVYKWS